MTDEVCHKLRVNNPTSFSFGIRQASRSFCRPVIRPTSANGTWCLVWQ